MSQRPKTNDQRPKTNNQQPKTNPRPKKKLGQNFLQDPAVLQKICQTAELKARDQVFEIGAGTGNLTELLAQQTQQVWAIEYDAEIFPLLKKRLSAHKNIILLQGDARQATAPTANFKLVANLPYYLTSPLLRRFLVENQVLPKLVTLLIQKEVAQKICAPRISPLSLAVQLYGQAEISGIVRPESFWPRPKVQSAILKITPHAEPQLPRALWPKFFQLICAGFRAPRKKIFSSLAAGLKLPKPLIQAMLETLKINPDLRPADLTFPDWKKILHYLAQQKKT